MAYLIRPTVGLLAKRVREGLYEIVEDSELKYKIKGQIGKWPDFDLPSALKHKRKSPFRNFISEFEIFRSFAKEMLGDNKWPRDNIRR